jgi:hypothetical protein
VHQVLILAAVTLPLLFRQPTSLAPNPRLGTWTLNLKKSTYEGVAPPRSETRTYVPGPDGAVTLTAITVLANGSTQTVRYTAKYDSKDYPYSGPAGDTISIRALDHAAFSTSSTVKRAGQIVQTALGIVAKDGKTMSYVTNGHDAAGKPINTTRIYEKQ